MSMRGSFARPGARTVRRGEMHTTPSRTQQLTIRIPVQSAPVSRDEWRKKDANLPQSGVTASQTVCDDLRGLARQMCYAVEYGVSI